MTPKEAAPLLTIAEAAAYLKLSESAVYALCASKRLGHFRLPVRGRGKIVTTPADCEAFLRSCRVEVAGEGESAIPAPPPRPRQVTVELPAGVRPFCPRA